MQFASSSLDKKKKKKTCLHTLTDSVLCGSNKIENKKSQSHLFSFIPLCLIQLRRPSTRGGQPSLNIFLNECIFPRAQLHSALCVGPGAHARMTCSVHATHLAILLHVVVQDLGGVGLLVGGQDVHEGGGGVAGGCLGIDGASAAQR